MKDIKNASKLILGVLVAFLSGCGLYSGKPGNSLEKSIKKYSSVEAAARESLKKAYENKALNAFIHIDENNVIEQAKAADFRKKWRKRRGPLDGALLVVKDNIHVAGIPNTAGTPALKNFIPKYDAPIIKYLKEAGAIILGKTNMHELAFGISSYNYAFYEEHIGVRNAHNLKRMAGGSSGGTAAAIGAGIVYGGLGTDTGGSVRIPAALNGIVGFRPTVGRYPQRGITPISHTRDTAGLMANDVKSIILLDSAIYREKTEDQAVSKNHWRLGVPKQFLKNMHPEVETLWRKAIGKFQKAGIVILDIDAKKVVELNSLIGFPVALYEAGVDMRSYLKHHKIGKTIEELAENIASPDVAKTYKNLVIPGKLPGKDGLVEAKPVYLKAIRIHRPNLVSEYESLFVKHQLDALIFPTTPVVARKANAESSSLENFILFIQNTDPGSNAGMPGLSIPMGVTKNNLPAGIEIDGLPDKDATLLSLGLILEGILKK